MNYEREYFSLTHPQQGIWYTSMMFPDTSISVVAGTAKIKAVLDFSLLEKAINLLIEKNDAFRTKLAYIDGQVKQYISDYKYVKIDFIDFSKFENPYEEMFRWDDMQTSLPFNLYDSDLAYFAVLKITDEESGFYAKTHHIISDAWTMSILVNEILEFYSALSKGDAINEEKFPSYIDYIKNEEEYINSDKISNDKEFWNEKLSPLPEMTVLKVRSTSEKRTESKRKTMLAPVKFTNKLREYCKNNNISPYPLFLAALGMYINRVTAKEDIIIGTPILNRVNKKEKVTAGMFINTPPLRLKVNPDMDLKSLSESVQMECMALLRHQKYPYDLLLKDVHTKYNTTDNLYDIVLSYQNSKMEKNSTEYKFLTRWHFNHHQVNSLTIHINDRDNEGRLIIDYDFHEDLYHVKEIEFLHNHMLSLLWHSIDNPERSIKNIEMLPESEKKKVLFDFNNTEDAIFEGKTVHQLFEEQALKNPNNIALVFEDQMMTYKELNDKANCLATILRAKGAKPDNVIALMMNRSMDIIVSIVAILKSSSAFLPIDPDYPDERINFMLEDSNVRMLLTERTLTSKIKTTVDVLKIENIKINTDNSKNLSNVNKSSDLAYVIYTSGSTGKPKGAMIEHRNAINLIHGISKFMDYKAGSSMLSMATISFDVFIFEILPSLAKGLKVIIANKEEQMVPSMTLNLISRLNIEKIVCTPSRMQSLADDRNGERLKVLKEIVIGGEVLNQKLLGHLKKLTNARIFNGYGPTETTVGVTFKELTSTNKINIGGPINNTKIYILDQQLNPVPIGIAGDLYIGGNGVGRGYINNPEYNNSKFIPNPFIKGEIIYSSGDLARWYPKGEIEFLGRRDLQVKIRGFRIELGEIESQLLKIDGINKAVVTTKEDHNSRKVLCAYYTASKQLPISEIRRQLSKYLPNYMIPSYFHNVESFPYTLNGKVDINNLPKINSNQISRGNHVKPRNEIEALLANSWKEVLHIDNIGIDSNFFELGGDSLSVIMLQANLLKYKWNVRTQDLYTYNTIRKLAKFISGLDTDSINRINKTFINSDPSVNNVLTGLNFQKANYKNYLLFGSTGFLGIHLLESLLCYPDTIIYCIVRGNSLENAKNRLRESLSFYFPGKHTNIIDKRVLVIKGDITKEHFGLEEREYNNLVNTVDAIIHTAALVKYYGDYSKFKSINVNGTLGIIDFAIKHNKPLFYISTLGLSGQYFSNHQSNDVFSEESLYSEEFYLDNVYIRSKYEAEKLIHRFYDSGLKAAIFRVGNLTGRFSDGHFQKNIEENSFYNINKSLIKIGAVSSNVLDVEFNLTPVDLCSNAIIELTNIKESLGKTFHIFNHNTINISDLLESYRAIGVNIVPMEKAAFEAIITDTCNDNINDISGIVNDLNSEHQLNFGSNVKIYSDFTLAYLQKLGFEWPKIDVSYIQKIYNYMRSVDFLNQKEA